MSLPADTVLLAHSHEILMLLDPVDLRVLHANGAACKVLGCTPKDLAGRPITDIECALASSFFWDEVRQGNLQEVEGADTEFKRADGIVLPAERSLEKASDGSGRLVVRAKLINAPAKEGEAVLISQLRSALEAAADGILLVDKAGRILVMNQRFAALWQIPEALLWAQDAEAIFKQMGESAADPEGYRRRLEEIALHPDLESADVVELRDGRVLERKSSPARDGELSVGRVFSFADVTRLRRYQMELEHIAYSDSLTGVANRVLLNDRIRHAIAQAKRKQEPVGLVYLDMDGFKTVNDRYGHEAGDQLLIAVTERVKQILRTSDTLARLGGDEFAIVLSDIHDCSETKPVIERLAEALREPLALSASLSLSVTASFGVAFFPQDGEDCETLLRHADQAMYRAKQSGKNRYVFFESAEADESAGEN
jgi:diguanylate cyclase (GGDEF)-like protein